MSANYHYHSIYMRFLMGLYAARYKDKKKKKTANLDACFAKKKIAEILMIMAKQRRRGGGGGSCLLPHFPPFPLFWKSVTTIKTGGLFLYWLRPPLGSGKSLAISNSIK